MASCIHQSCDYERWEAGHGNSTPRPKYWDLAVRYVLLFLDRNERLTNYQSVLPREVAERGGQVDATRYHPDDSIESSSTSRATPSISSLLTGLVDCSFYFPSASIIGGLYTRRTYIMFHRWWSVVDIAEVQDLGDEE